VEDERRIREWRQKKTVLEKLPGKKRRLEEGGRKAALPDMEEELIGWLEGCRAKNFRVTRKSLQRHATVLASTQGIVLSKLFFNFKASRGWLERFMKRHGFSLCRRTTVSQRLPKDLVLKVTAFIMGTRRLSNQYALGSMGNMNETPLWLDMPGETTVPHTGVRSVPVRTTGHEKNQFTVVLSAMADGRKLKPYRSETNTRASESSWCGSGTI
jgi:hypothetical protein